MWIQLLRIDLEIPGIRKEESQSNEEMGEEEYFALLIHNHLSGVTARADHSGNRNTLFLCSIIDKIEGERNVFSLWSRSSSSIHRSRPSLFQAKEKIKGSKNVGKKKKKKSSAQRKKSRQKRINLSRFKRRERKGKKEAEVRKDIFRNSSLARRRRLFLKWASGKTIHICIQACACVRVSFRAASMIIVKCSTLTTSNTQKLHFHFSFESNFAAFIEPIEIQMKFCMPKKHWEKDAWLFPKREWCQKGEREEEELCCICAFSSFLPPSALAHSGGRRPNESGKSICWSIEKQVHFLCDQRGFPGRIWRRHRQIRALDFHVQCLRSIWLSSASKKWEWEH